MMTMKKIDIATIEAARAGGTDARALRPSVFLLYLEGADPALRERDAVRVQRGRPGSSRSRGLRRGRASGGQIPDPGRRRDDRARGDRDHRLSRGLPSRRSDERRAGKEWVSP